MASVIRGSDNFDTATVGITSGTAVATTSGTSIDFTGIPAETKRITVMFSGVSLSGMSHLLVQMGNTTPTVSGYTANTTYNTGVAVGVLSSVAGIPIQGGDATYAIYGSLVLTNISGDIWTVSGVLGNTANVAFTVASAGIVTLAATLDMIRLTTVNGTDTFDAGSINILYE